MRRQDAAPLDADGNAGGGVTSLVTACQVSADAAFGTAVSLARDLALVGAPGSNSGAGAAHVFRRVGTDWVEEQRLAAFDGAAADGFGASVAASAETLVVGAWLSDDGAIDSGSVYVFRPDGPEWVLEVKLVSPEPMEKFRFGASVAVSDDVILVGGAQLESYERGVHPVYVFRRRGTSWIHEASLIGAGATVDGRFGASVAVSNGVAVVGEFLHSVPLEPLQGSGAVYVFRHTAGGWIQEQMLGPSDPVRGGQFGFVSISGDIVVVGAPGAVNDGAGAVYVYRREGEDWKEQSRLAAGATSGDRFGQQVAVIDQVAIVGAPRTDVDGVEDAGAAYVFRANGTDWIEERRLVAPEPGLRAQFGSAVSTSQTDAIVGASNVRGDGAAFGVSLL